MPHKQRGMWFLLINLLILPAWAGSVAVGKPMPAIQAKLLDTSATVRIAPGDGKVTIINFWASWCAPCRAEMPALQAYYEKHKAQGLQIVAISMDEPGDIDKVRAIAQLYTFPIALQADADFSGLSRIWRMPSTFVMDQNGVLQKNGHEGRPTIDLELLEAVVTPLFSAH